MGDIHSIDRGSFAEALRAHEEWKELFERSIKRGVSDLPVEVLQVHAPCPLGQLLRSQTGSLTDRTALEILRDIHAGFHSAADRILDLAIAGRMTEAIAALEEGKAYSDWSAMLVYGLRRYLEDQREVGEHRAP